MAGNNFCIKYGQAVRARQHGLLCKNCEMWRHRTCGTGFLCLTTEVLAEENYNLTGNVKNAVLMKHSPGRQHLDRHSKSPVRY